MFIEGLPMIRTAALAKTFRSFSKARLDCFQPEE
jgi:hypothetical protein